MKPQEERISFTNNKGQKLIGYYHKEYSDTLMILYHGLEPFSETPGLIEIFHEYHKIGISVLRFDSTGYGESEGEKKLDLEQRVLDIGSAIEQIGNKYKKVIIYAPSFATIPAILSALRYPKVKKLITVNGLFNFHELAFKTRLQIKLHFLKSSRDRRQLAYYKKHFKPENLKISVLVVYSDKDELVKPKQSLNFFKNLKTDKKILRIVGGDHKMLDKKYLYPHFEEFKKWILA